MKAMSSLGGQSDTGRRNSARSSRASSTIFKKLRKLDSEIGKLEYQLRFGEGHTIALRGNPFLVKTLKRIKELDERRKVVRAERKSFHGIEGR